MSGIVVISSAVEGLTDEAVVQRLILNVGATPGTTYGKNGKAGLHKKIRGYNNAAQHSPWVVLVDLDQDADCAPPLREDWLPVPARYICFRVAVRGVEAWLLADRQRIASFLGVSVSRVPTDPETLAYPKQTMVNLARQSRRRDIREDMVPRPESRRTVGPAYTSRVIEFVANHWRPDIARQHADSLARGIQCLQRLVGFKHAEWE